MFITRNRPHRAAWLALVIATAIGAPRIAGAAATFALEVGGSSTITTVAPGTQLTLDLRVDVPAGEVLGTYGVSVRLGPGDSFVSASSTPPPPFFGGFPPEVFGLDPQLVTQWSGLGLTGNLPGPVNASIGTLTFDYFSGVTIIEIGILAPGVDGLDSVITPSVEFRSLRIVPEPSTALLVAFGLGGLARRQRA